MQGDEQDPPFRLRPSSEPLPPAVGKSRRIGGPAEASARVIRLERPAPEPSRAAPPLIETLRVVDLRQLRLALSRQKAAALRRGQPDNAITTARLAVLDLLDRRYKTKQARWPMVVIVKSDRSGPIRTNIAVTGETIYLGDHLSASWDAGREDAEFYVKLHDALLMFDEMPGNGA